MKKENQQWKPYITLEQILAFDPLKPETSTGSPFVDTILRMFFDPEISLGANFSKHLGLDCHDVSGYLVIATGYRLVDLRRLWTKHRVKELRAKDPDLTQKDMARILGYKDPSSMWRFLNAEEQTRLQKEYRKRISEHTMMDYWPSRHD